MFRFFAMLDALAFCGFLGFVGLSFFGFKYAQACTYAEDIHYWVTMFLGGLVGSALCLSWLWGALMVWWR
jgi:hypothetical protein